MSASNRLGDVIGILAITILIDGKVHPREPEEFRYQLERLSVFTSHFDREMTKTTLPDWYAHNWQPLRAVLQSEQSGAHVRAALACITDRELASALFASMCQIAVADDELHDAETTLLRRAAKAWDIDLT